MAPGANLVVALGANALAVAKQRITLAGAQLARMLNKNAAIVGSWCQGAYGAVSQ
jgi:hypothetical protein